MKLGSSAGPGGRRSPRGDCAGAAAPTRTWGRRAARLCSALGAASDGLRERYEASRSPLDMGSRPGQVRPGSRVPYVPTAALVVRRELVDFDAAMRVGEDVDLVWRLVEDGWSVRYEPGAVVTHRPRASWWGWLAQRFGYGCSAAPLAARHPGPLRPVRGTASATAAALVLAARPGVAAATVVGAVSAASAWRTVRRLERRFLQAPDPRRLAVALTFGGRRHVVESAADTARRTWLPLLALAGRPGRRVVFAVAVVPAARDWWAGRPDVGLLSYLGLRLADDAAYCLGVWYGCLRSGTLEPLLPVRRHRDRAGMPGPGTAPESTAT